MVIYELVRPVISLDLVEYVSFDSVEILSKVLRDRACSSRLIGLDSWEIYVKSGVDARSVRALNSGCVL
jgi:hypothetical protein